MLLAVFEFRFVCCLIAWICWWYAVCAFLLLFCVHVVVVFVVSLGFVCFVLNLAGLGWLLVALFVFCLCFAGCLFMFTAGHVCVRPVGLVCRCLICLLFVNRLTCFFFRCFSVLHL